MAIRKHTWPVPKNSPGLWKGAVQLCGTVDFSPGKQLFILAYLMSKGSGEMYVNYVVKSFKGKLWAEFFFKPCSQ